MSVEIEHREGKPKGAWVVEQDGERLAEMTYSWAGDDMFIIDMQDCPSAKLVHQSGRIEPYNKYCEHCQVLYPPLIREYGYEVDYDIISCKKGRCRMTVVKPADVEK